MSYIFTRNFLVHSYETGNPPLTSWISFGARASIVALIVHWTKLFDKACPTACIFCNFGSASSFLILWSSKRAGGSFFGRPTGFFATTSQLSSSALAFKTSISLCTTPHVLG